MWNKKADEPAPARPQTPPPPMAPPAPAYTPPPPVAQRPTGPAAIIGKAVTIKGDIYSEEDLVIDGEVEGTIEVKDHMLTIGTNGKAKSSMIRARDVVVLGAIQGNIECTQKLSVRKDGKLIGDVRTAGIVIDDEAYFKGSIDITREDK
jgi:cytoskeletal protein CcmA (bactofilin family)